MGDRDVDEIIAQWRASARAAGEPVPGGRESILRRSFERIGALRAVLAVAAICIFAAAAVPLLRGQSDPVGLPPGGAAAEQAPTDPPDAGAGAPDPAADAVTQADRRTADAAPPLAGRVDDWFAVIVAADRARAAAYAAADPAPLAAAFAPEGAASAREGELVAALAANGVVAEGWRTEVLAVSPVEQTPDGAILRVRDRRDAYRLVDPDGGETAVVASEPATWLVTLRRDGAAGWLVVEAVAEATTPSGPP